jgi:hypothetical protein
MFQSCIFNLVLSNSKTHLIVNVGDFHIYPERARDSDGVVARFARTLTTILLHVIHLLQNVKKVASITDRQALKFLR